MTEKENTVLSVIIPVWQTPEKLVKRSVASAISCKSSAPEILLVDDGNDRELSAALDRMAAENETVSVLHKKHEGVSAARNAGVQSVSGEYVTFLDADDELNPDALDEILVICRDEHPDLIISRISRATPARGRDMTVLDDGRSLRRELRVYYTTLQNPDFRNTETWINRAPHGRFVKRELALKCRMKEDLPFGEDVIWNFDLLNCAGSVVVTDLQTYLYKEHSFSATQKFRKDFPAELKCLLNYYRKEIRHWPAEDRKYYDTAAVEYFTILMRLYVFTGTVRDSRIRFEEAFSDPMWRGVFRRCRMDTLKGRYRLTGMLGKYRCRQALYLMMFVYNWSVRKKSIHRKQNGKQKA